MQLFKKKTCNSHLTLNTCIGSGPGT